jgi:hypothetical protein
MRHWVRDKVMLDYSLMKKLIFYFLLTALCANILAAETCSRIAVINHQEVLVDTNSTEKGEGLRFYLEKDPKAKGHLDKYQKGTQIRWQNAILGSVGSSLLIAGFLQSKGKSRDSLLIGGATFLAVNFLVAKTLDMVNEENLIKAINEYNRRNLPKIYFNPKVSSAGPLSGHVFALVKSWEF